MRATKDEWETIGATEVQEALIRNEVGKKHYGDKYALEQVAAEAGEFCTFSALRCTKPLEIWSQFSVEAWIRWALEAFSSLDGLWLCVILNLGKVPYSLKKPTTNKPKKYFFRKQDCKVNTWWKLCKLSTQPLKGRGYIMSTHASRLQRTSKHHCSGVLATQSSWWQNKRKSHTNDMPEKAEWALLLLQFHNTDPPEGTENA